MIFVPTSTPLHRILASVFVLALTALPVLASPFQAIILPGGTEGDLVQVQTDGEARNLRLYGVASPVTGQPTAGTATTHILETAMEAVVTIEIVGEDTTGTPVAWIKLPDGTSLNEALVRKGLAWWDAPNTPEARNLQKAATEAIAAGRGLWAAPAPLAPWDYRASNGQAVVAYKKTEPSLPPLDPPATAEPTPTLKAKGEMKEAAGEEYFPDDPADHMALMLKHQPRMAYDSAGQPVGLTATDIASVPGAGRVGLKNGDIVQSVNGIALTSQAQVLGLVTQLQGAKSIELTILRNGAPTQITVPLELD